MIIFVFFLRTIALTTALTACSSFNEEAVYKDIKLLEEVTEDVIELSENEESTPPVKKQKEPVIKKKKRYPPSSGFKRS